MLASIALVYSFTGTGQAITSARPLFEDEIRRFEQQDVANPPEPGGIVFVGSSSIRLWSTLRQDFPGHSVINRGFGGSQVSDSVQYVDRIVTNYRPRLVVFFAGTNDLASGKPAEVVLEDFRAFAGRVHAKLPKTRIIYLSITPAPARWANVGEVRQANRLIKEYTMKRPFMFFVDMYDEFVTITGDPRPELFVEDQLHLNSKGYEVWTLRLRPILAAFTD